MLRPATIQDAQPIAEIHVASWQAAYDGLLPDSFLRRLSLDRRLQMWSSILAEATPGTWVVEEDGRLWGFVNFGPCRDKDLNREKVGEIYAIYLSPEAWGRGYGRALCQQALASLKEAGFKEASLWVLQENKAAIAFYEKAGFITDHTTKTDQWDEVTLREVRYRQPL